MAVQDKDRGWRKIVAALGVVGHAATVGIQGDEAAEDHGEFTNVQLGVIHEFGAPERGIPERSFIRATFDASRPQLARLMEKGAAKILGGEMTQEQVVGLVGEKLLGDIKKRINDGIPPPNAPATIAAKGSSKPLIDTGQLKASITVVVRDTSKAEEKRAT